MKKYILIFIALIGNFAFSQKKIYLNISEEGRFSLYSFQNAEDEKYLVFKWREVMGVKGYQYYVFREENMKDGEYQIFIDNVLVEKTSFKNKKRHGYTAYYNPRGQVYKEENYAEGKKNGIFRMFDENGNLETFAEYENDDYFLKTEYHPNGEVKNRVFAFPNTPDAYIENYDENGRVSSTSQSYFPYVVIKQLEQNFKDGKPHGQQRYFFLKYTYIVEYDNGKLLKYTLKDDNWEVIKEKTF